MSIPRLLHQLWIGDRPMPKKLMQTWKDKHPKWLYMLWDDEKIKTIAWKNYKLIDNILDWNGKCDVIRWEILYRFGGFFADADSICLNPVDELLKDWRFISCYENEQHNPGLIATGFMGCEQWNYVPWTCMEELSEYDKPTSASWEFCGPGLLTRVLEDCDLDLEKIKIYPSYVFLPVHGTGLKYIGNEKIYADHYWGSTKELYGKEKSWE